ncbi:putative ATPase [Coemansia thaxteri]|nr:putative ATPase [Coemansia thaxteri]KAJ2467074.1 putative ATPase [Coemansia sp. RSA 2322]
MALSPTSEIQSGVAADALLPAGRDTPEPCLEADALPSVTSEEQESELAHQASSPAASALPSPVVEEKKESLRELRTQAMAQYEAVTEDKQRLQRLNFLLEKSAAYVSFVAKKLDSKRAQMRSVGDEDRAEENGNGGAASDKEAEPLQPAKRKGKQQKQAPRSKRARTKLALDDSKQSDDAAVVATEPSVRVIDGERVSARQPLLITGGIMREYQLEGMEWLASLYENGLNGILADEMGLGKTLQTIAFLCFLRERQVWGPFLVLCPLSTLSNWVSEFYRFTPTTPVLLYHGTPDERKELRSKHLRRLDKNFPIVVTTYEISMRDKQALQRFAWKFIIVDEGHRIKNMNCKLIRDLKSYQSTNRLLLTGTPLQNSLSELWSLLNFLLPDIFDDLDSFQEWFNFNDISEREGQSRILSEQTTNNVVSKLHQILQPFLLRRLKVDVEKFLPPKREYLIACPMAPMQYEYYQAVRGPNLRRFLEEKFVAEGKVAAAADADDNTLVPGTPASDAPVLTPAPAITKKRGQHTVAVKQAGFLAEATSFLGLQDSLGDDAASGRSGRQSRVSRKKNVTYAEVNEDDSFDSDGLETIQIDEVADELEDMKLLKPGVDTDPLARLKAAVLVRQMNLQFRLMQQRKVCQHPYLFDFPVKDQSDPESEFLIDEQLVRASGKLLILDRLLPELFSKGHRVLIFSQFARVLDILEFYAELRDWRFCRIDGSVSQTDRQDAIVRFNTDPAIPLFFLTTRSGGLGINLTAADTVVLFDSDWNPQQDLQAQDRVHRIGQKRPVIIYRLIIAGSCENAMLNRAKAKRKLEKLVIHERRFKGIARHSQSAGGPDEVSVQDIAQILMDDDTDLVEKDQKSLRTVLESLGPDQQVPPEAVLSSEELFALTDRSPEAYAKKDAIDSARFTKLEQIRDEQNDLLAKMESASH